MESWIRDVRIGLRSLVKRPGFAAVVVITLALGIGANAAIFSVVNAVLLRPLPYPEPDRLVRIWSAYPADGEELGATSPLDLDDWREQNDVLEDVAGFPRVRMSGFVLTGGETPAEIETMFVTEGFFSTLAAPAFLGRTFDADDHVEGRNRVVILSYGAWQRRFGGDPGIVGGSLTLDGDAFTVVGVMPEAFEYPAAETEMWAPLSLIPDSGVPRLRPVRWLNVVGRLKAGVTLERAKASMDTIAARLAEAYPDSNERLTAVTIRSLYSETVGDVRAALLTVFAAVALVLLVACANVANLVLARSETRSKEIAVRTALGASRFALARQLVVESLLLASLGGVLGCVVAHFGVEALMAMAPSIPRLSSVGVDGAVLAFTALVAAMAGLVIGLLPVMRLAVSDLNGWLKEGGRGASTGSGSRAFRSALVVAEVALVVVLSTCAALLIRSYVELMRVDPGVSADDLLTMSVTAHTYEYPTRPDYVGFFERVQESVQGVPGVLSAGWVRPFPLRGDTFEGESFTFTVDGEPSPPEGREPTANMRFVSPGYFRTMGIPLLSGRDFDARDDGPPLVVVINRTAATRYFPGDDPVGDTISAGSLSGVEIVGVVGDVRQLTLSQEPAPAVYVTLRQVARVGMTLVVRTASDPVGLMGPVQDAIWSVNPDQTIEQIATMRSVIEASAAKPRFSMVLLGLFAGLALVLAAIGIYGVVSYDVSRETHDIGIRMALGANRGDILRMTTGKGLALAFVGIGIGLAGALVGARLMSSLLFRVSATDPLSLFGAAVLLACVAVGASLIPARRAASVDPIVALRYE